ncbi:MAG: factor H binding family protein [Moraxella sp.]|nr:factor H binding family protein [Moraxella sp.]
MKKTFLHITLGMSAFALAACSSGGNSSNHAASTTPVVNPAPTTGGTAGTNNNTGNNASTNTGGTTTGNTASTNTTQPTSKVTDTYSFVLSQEEIDDIKEELGASAVSQPTVTIDGKAHGLNLELNKLPQGLSNRTVVSNLTATINNQAHTVRINETVRAYHQPNSIVLGSRFEGATVSGASLNKTIAGDKEVSFHYVTGNATKTLPTAGTFNYSGKSFDIDSEGTFNYAINFASKTGQGSVALDGKSISLEEGRIIPYTFTENGKTHFEGYGISGATNGADNGGYTLGIFGNNAEEVAGHINSTTGNGIGFGGVKK